MEGREAGRSSQLESTTAPPSQREKKQQLDQVQPATTQTHETPDPTLAIGNSPRFLGDRQPLPDELQLLEDFQLLLDEGQVALPRSTRALTTIWAWCISVSFISTSLGVRGPCRYLESALRWENAQKCIVLLLLKISNAPHYELLDLNEEGACSWKLRDFKSFWEANYNESRCSLFWRFLVANEGHLAHAKEQLTKDIAWREDIKLYELQGRTREEIVGVDDAFFLEQYPCIFLGYEDEANNYAPVVYRSLTHLQTKALAAKGVTVEKMVKHELWQYETDCKLLFSHPESFPARQLKVIIDINGMTWGQCTKDLVSILSGFSSFSKLHHPERLQKLFIIGAPKPFLFIWNTIISHIIPVSTKNKITILHTFEGHLWLEAWMAKLPAALEDAKAKAASAPTGPK